MVNKVDFDDFQNAFACGDISLEQFMGVLADNFGVDKTIEILNYNLKLALEQENENI